MTSLEKRIRALEAKSTKNAVDLFFSDGSKREIRGQGNFLAGLLSAACAGKDLSPEQAAQLDLIGQSVAAQEPGGARIAELIRIFVNGPKKNDSATSGHR